MGKSPALVRLDALLVKRGLAASRQRAQELIEEGAVLVNGLVAKKSAMRVRTDQPAPLKKEDYPWVGRGALKLLGALEPFGVTCTNDVCADFGSSTGGFTQVLLHHGAKVLCDRCRPWATRLEVAYRCARRCDGRNQCTTSRVSPRTHRPHRRRPVLHFR